MLKSRLSVKFSAISSYYQLKPPISQLSVNFADLTSQLSFKNRVISADSYQLNLIQTLRKCYRKERGEIRLIAG